MSANFEAKKVVVQEITEKIKASKSVVIVDYNKLTVKEVSELRSKCKKAGCEYKVYKNTLVRKALNDLGFNDFDSDLNGPTAVAFGSDETNAAKVMTAAAKDYDGKIVLKSSCRYAVQRGTHCEDAWFYQCSRNEYRGRAQQRCGRSGARVERNRTAEASLTA